MKIISMAKRLR